MSEENQGQEQNEGQQGEGQESQGQPAGGALSETERVKVNGAEMVKSKAEILEAAQKYMAGEKLMDQFAQEKQQWTEEQRQTLNDAQFGRVFRKAVTDKDPAAMREVLVGLGVAENEASQQVSSWERRMAGKQPAQQAQAQGQPQVEQLLSQMAEAVIAVGKQNEELKGRLEQLEGGVKTLDTRDMARAEQEMMAEVENAIKADEFHGDFAGKSPRYLNRLKRDAASIMARRLQSGEKDIQKALRDSLDEARAALEDYSDAFAGRDIPSLSGLPSKGSALDAYRPKKAPDPVSMLDPKYGENLMERIEAWMPDIQKEADGS